MPEKSSTYLRVAVFAPLRQHFHYLPPLDIHPAEWVGCRVRVPFGKQPRYGVVLALDSQADVQDKAVKPILELLDPAPLLPASLQSLLDFAAQYYQHPIGEVWATALPVLLRQGAMPPNLRLWTLSDSGLAQCQRDPPNKARQQQLLACLRDLRVASEAALATRLEGAWRPAFRRCLEQGWVIPAQRPLPTPAAAPWTLNPAQQQAVDAIQAASGFTSFLLNGVTGSGKTAVYLEAITPLLAMGKQALILVPDISLTPQLLQRFADRFGADQVAALHSGLTDRQRLHIWDQARRGDIAILIGTRSALFTPLARPGIIIVDEEHDPSLKQQEGFRYSARDLAVMRARLEDIPIVLGSATPALESLHNVSQGRYQLLSLPERAGGAQAPQIGLIDLRLQKLQGGLSPSLLRAIKDTLKRQEQVLLFINRRGYAPAVLCHACGWVAHCRHCSVPMTLHRAAACLRCHHCGHQQGIPKHCGNSACGSSQISPLGQGTEQIEASLQMLDLGVPIQRIDRDSMRHKGRLEATLAALGDGQPRILVGTQMLAKGHHFPQVTLVGVINADQGLFSADFRGQERLLSMILQVSGRAGRAERPGQVLIQTHHPDHPLIQALKNDDYNGYSQQLLNERRLAGLPPYAYLAMLHAEASQAEAALQFLQQAGQLLKAPELSAHGPFPAPIERRANRYRCQLWLMATRRDTLAQALKQALPAIEKLPGVRKLRWNLDIDPVDLI